MINQDLAQLFDKTADVLAVKGENSFKINAYRRIARVLEELPESVELMLTDGRLAEVPGIGESSLDKIREFLKTGHISEFIDLWSQVPAGVMDLMKVPSVGPKTAALLWQEQGIVSIDQLSLALEKPGFGSLVEIPGLGTKKLEKIKQNIAFLAKSSGRVSLGQAMPLAEELVALFKGVPGVVQAQFCGSLRRGRETVGDVDIAVAVAEGTGGGAGGAKAVFAALTSHPMTAEVIGSGDTKTSVRTTSGLQIDVRVVPAESWGAAILYFTGSKEHGIRLREIAIKKGLKLNEWGLFKDEKNLASHTEADIYKALDLAWIPPEMREDHNELKRFALHQKPPAKPWEVLEIADLQGDLHMHTTASDGRCSIEDMVAECKRRGFSYLAITDHSKSSFQANGLRVERLLEHIQAIHAVAKEAAKSGMLVLAGSEVDILADGSLDYEDEVLAQLDWVVASPHAALSQETDEATQRLVRVAANPYVHVIGHPTGRLVPTRKGMEPDMAKVIFAAARHGVALELNANHHRLDLRDIHLQMAGEAGVPVCINTDAHSLEDFEELRYGILTARRGWLQAANVLNTRPLEAFKKWLKERKSQASW